MAPQEDTWGEVEGIVHISGGVIEWRIECSEVVPLGLGLRTAHASEAEPTEHLADLVDHDRHRMSGTAPSGTPGEGQIEPLLSDPSLCLQLGRALLECLLQDTLDPIGFGPDLGPILGIDLTQVTQDRGQPPLAASEEIDSDSLSGLGIFRSSDELLPLPFELCQCLFKISCQSVDSII